MDGMLSQEEINALLGGMTGKNPDDNDVELLTDVEKDAVGEISNISMGTAATTLSTLVNDVVNITTPKVSYSTLEKVAASYERPCVFIHISYKEGLDGSNLLLLKEEDVKIITDLMMGGDGTGEVEDLSDMHLSAIGEAMNQMMGSAATSLSSMLNKKVDINPPVASQFDINTDALSGDMKVMAADTLVIVSFKMEIGDLVNSEIMQMFPLSFAREMYELFKTITEKNLTGGDSSSTDSSVQTQEPAGAIPTVSQPNMSQPEANQPTGQQPFGQQQMGGYGYQSVQSNVQPTQFQNFMPVNPVIQQENIGLIMDVPLEVSVELGRANKSIKEILDFSPGTIIELNKLAGEPVDVFVNGKLVAKGEVVVIEENFGIRITEILKNV